MFDALVGLQGSLDYHLQRQTVLAANIAHIDTPGYVPKDLERDHGASFASVFQVALDRTNPTHLSGSEATTAGRVFNDPTAGVGTDHNGVSLDREAAKIAANQVRYDVISALTSSELSGLSFAANDGKG